MAPTLSRRRDSVSLQHQADLDLNPLKFCDDAGKNGFHLRARSVRIIGKPTDDHFTRAFTAACSVHEAAPYWIGDLLNAAESHEDWKALADQIISITGLARQTLLNLSYVSDRVDDSARAIAPTPAHAAEVARLPAGERHGWLKEARERGLSRGELRREIRAKNRPSVLIGQAKLEGQFRVILADPVWPDRPNGMSLDTLCRLPIAAHAAADAVLFLRVPVQWMLRNPGAREVGEAWGFKAASAIVWDAVLGNNGEYVRVRHSNLTIWTRGDCKPDRPTDMPDSVQLQRRDDALPGIPHFFRQMIERMYDGPYAEFFARDAVKGWSTFGSDPAEWKNRG